jgi:transcriptional regulator with XRE-family HTH domain
MKPLAGGSTSEQRDGTLKCTMKNKVLDSTESISERALACRAGLSRSTVRALKAETLNPTLRTLRRLSDAQNRDLEVFDSPRNSEADTRFSVPVVSWLVIREGFTSWKIHFFDLVDEVRRTKDYRLIVAPPIRGLDKKLRALLSSIVLELCRELSWTAPIWARREPRLNHPWFVSGSEALKATALSESPVHFKEKNIFVLENFLTRI